MPLVLLHMSPRSGAMFELLQEKLERPTYAPDRLGYGFSDAPPWALSLEQPRLQSTVDPLKAADIDGDVDLLGIHTGSIEAIEVAHQLGSHVRRVVVMGMPLFSAEEQQRQLEKYSEQPLRPVTEGDMCCWAPGVAVSPLRQPPYDLGDVHRRFVEHVLAANPVRHFAPPAATLSRRNSGVWKAPLTVFTLRTTTSSNKPLRVKSLLKAGASYVDLPELSADPFHAAVDRMVTLVNRRD